MVMKAAHTFNLLDARGAISVTERAAYIGRVRATWRARRPGLLRLPRSPRLPDAEEGGRVMTSATLLVELLTEELPPKALPRWARPSPRRSPKAWQGPGLAPPMRPSAGSPRRAAWR
jgi:glycyl-tRNA synthetase alpha chain